MKLLLGTHAFLWGIAGKGLSTNASAAFLNLENELYLSAASYWEICIKGSLGKLQLVTDWPRQFEREITANALNGCQLNKSIVKSSSICLFYMMTHLIECSLLKHFAKG